MLDKLHVTLHLASGRAFSFVTDNVFVYTVNDASSRETLMKVESPDLTKTIFVHHVEEIEIYYDESGGLAQAEVSSYESGLGLTEKKQHVKVYMYRARRF